MMPQTQPDTVAFTAVASVQATTEVAQNGSQSTYSPTNAVFSKTFDWSGTGRGKHVDFARDEELPLQIGRSLGEGATSEVREATCQQMSIAVKRKKLVHNRKAAIEIFRREMKTLERISDHPHVVQIIGSFVHNRVVGILLWPVAVCDLAVFLYDYNDLLELPRECWHLLQDEVIDAVGEEGWERLEALDARRLVSLDDPFDHRYSCIGRHDISPGLYRLAHSFEDLAGALAYIHEQHVKHKDLKPSNILLTRDSIYLTDFGISTDFSEHSTSVTEDGLRGTPRYFAPEVAKFQPSGRAADIFSLGCIFLHMAYIASAIPLQELDELMPKENRSFHANLDNTDAWLDQLHSTSSGAQFSAAFSELVRWMFAFEPDARPTASQVVARLHDAPLKSHSFAQQALRSKNSGMFGLTCRPKGSDDRKAYYCLYCAELGQLKFSQTKQDWKRHMQHHHVTGNKWHCSVRECSQTFLRGYDFREHRRQHREPMPRPNLKPVTQPPCMYPCGFEECREVSHNWKDYCDHVAICMQRSKCEWSYSRTLCNLLRRREYLETWESVCSRLCLETGIHEHDLEWHPGPLGDMRWQLQLQQFQYAGSDLEPFLEKLFLLGVVARAI